MNITLDIVVESYAGRMTVLPFATETQYFFDLGQDLRFIIYINEQGEWETEQSGIDWDLVKAAGNRVEQLDIEIAA